MVVKSFTVKKLTNEAGNGPFLKQRPLRSVTRETTSLVTHLSGILSSFSRVVRVDPLAQEELCLLEKAGRIFVLARLGDAGMKLEYE